MKLLFKNWKIVLSFILIVILGVYVCEYGIAQALNFRIFSKPTVDTKIYTVWHVETFEGGGKSRILYLKDIADSIEKTNDGILFNIKQIAPENLESELNLSTPDIISFGFGLGKVVLPFITPQTQVYNIRDNLIKSSTYANKIYALPYIVSGYALISHDEKNTKTIYGKNSYVTPLPFIKSASKFQSQYEAYKEFANNKKVNLIGTARDVFRVDNLNKLGRTNATFCTLNDYTDLVQYIATTKNDKITQLFVENLLNVKNQSKLINYSLFSSLHTKLYSTGIYNDMENALLNANVPNVFYE